MLFDPPVSTRANASRSVGVGAKAFCVVPSHAVPSPLTPVRPRNLFDEALGNPEDTLERMDAAGDEIDEKLDKDEKLERDVEVVVPVLPQSSGGIFTRRNIPPFVPSQDIVRGIVFVGQAALGYAFMLAVM